MTQLDYARHCWGLLQRLADQHREGELVVMMRLLAEAGKELDHIPTTVDEVRAAMKNAPRTLKSGAEYWADAQGAKALEDLWLPLGQMDAALILDDQDYAAIGVTDELIGGLIRRLARK